MAAKKKIKEIVINTNWCKGCRICVSVCPKHVLAMDQLVATVVDLDSCIVCGLCEMSCPDFCIEVIPEGESAAVPAGSAQNKG